jgi:hypothetical protein
MAWQHEEAGGSDTGKWPTASTRLNWARNNYSRYTLQRKMERLMILLMNVTALGDLIEEESGEAFLKPGLRKQWRSWYEALRPTNPVGRPKNGSETGLTE